MTEYENKEDSFEFEKCICFEKPELWKNEAYGLFASAQVLYEFANIQNCAILGQDERLNTLFSEDITDRIYLYYRIIRMLWGYGFENVLKGIIIKNLKLSTSEFDSVPIDKIKTHNLTYLFNEAGFRLNSDQEFYIKIVQKCSIWMGRYPLPAKADQMYEQRKPMKSSAELLERSKLRIEEFINDEIERIECESDVLHSAIGDKEFKVIYELIDLTKQKINE